MLANQDAFVAVVTVKPKLYASEPCSLREIASYSSWHKSVVVGTSGADEWYGDIRSTEPGTQALALEMKSIIDSNLECDCLFVSHETGLQRLFHRASDSRGRAFAQVVLSRRLYSVDNEVFVIIIPNPGEDLGQAFAQVVLSRRLYSVDN